MLQRKQTNRVIFHHSLSSFGDANIVKQWHLERGFEDIGYHFVLPLNSFYQEGRNLKFTGAHAKGKNFDSIGVCLIGDFSKTRPTQCQLCESQLLYRRLCDRYGFLAVEFHHETCPGPLLDRVYFIKLLREGVK